MDKLLKKVLRKQHSYEDITDKLGVRVILYFRHDIEAADRVIQSQFDIRKREDKSQELGIDRWGYQGIHFDATLGEPHLIKPEFKGLVFEIQLQTCCQNVWCDLNHELYYKTEVEVPKDYVRSINRLSALLETADLEFERSQTMISQLPRYEEVRLLGILEKPYFELSARPYDKELSLEVISKLCGSYDGLSAESYRSKIDSFVETARGVLEQAFNDYASIPDRSLFLFQPEGLLLLLLMDENPFMLKSVWCESFPLDELETLAAIFGRRIS